MSIDIHQLDETRNARRHPETRSLPLLDARQLWRKVVRFATDASEYVIKGSSKERAYSGETGANDAHTDFDGCSICDTNTVFYIFS